MRHLCAGVFVALFVVDGAASSVQAHHSVAGQFDTSKPITLKGVVSKVEWINPHVYVYMDVKEQDGSTTQWALSTLPTAMMRKAGLTKESLMGKPGEEISVSAVPARDGTKHLAWISKITYADGHYHQLAGQ
jgi:hypothetical protein